MNYRHGFHAGNFADVFKHAVLIGLLEAFKGKKTPLCYFDTHSGRGRYDLGGDQANRTREAADGVLRLVGETQLPTLLHIYMNLVRSLNDRGAERELVVYPGSPLLAQLLLRENDRAVLCEMQAEEAQALRALFRDDKRFQVHQRNGYEALPAMVPPAERRGVVLIDPPYEAQEDEFRLIEAALGNALKRWPQGCYAIWYPIKLRQAVRPFRRWLAGCGADRVLDSELLLHPDNSSLRLNGCGMAIINPPWRFERQIEELLAALRQLLAQSRFSSAEIDWLTGP